MQELSVAIGNIIYSYEFPSTTKAASHAIEGALAALSEDNWVPEGEEFCVRLCLEEALVNAVVHGNESDPHRMVRIDLRDEGETCRITIHDEGEGFDHRAINMELPKNPARIRRRGYILINALSEKIDFYDDSSRVIVYVDTKGEALYSIKNLSKT